MDRQSGSPANLGLKPSCLIHRLSGADNSSTGSVPKLLSVGLTRVFKPIAIGHVHWLWTVLRSVILARYSSLVLLLSPECVSPASAVEMWG
jgi:hypothetical protein